MTHDPREALEPCPFCGSQPSFESSDSGCIIKCTDDGCWLNQAEVFEWSDDDAARRWNTRALTASPGEQKPPPAAGWNEAINWLEGIARNDGNADQLAAQRCVAILRAGQDYRREAPSPEGVGRDAIGLSERLRDYRVWSRTHQRYDAVELTQEAAAALDALQARVKELEAEQAAIVRDYQRMNSQLADEMKRATRAEQERAEEWNLRREAGSQRDAAKAVSETLRQERDEAYERAAKVAEGLQCRNCNSVIPVRR